MFMHDNCNWAVYRLIFNDLHSPLKALLDDLLYIGVPQKRVTGKPYDDLIDEFINAATNR